MLLEQRQCQRGDAKRVTHPYDNANQYYAPPPSDHRAFLLVRRCSTNSRVLSSDFRVRSRSTLECYSDLFTDYVIQDGDELPSSAAVPSLISDCVVYFIHILFTNAYFRGRIIIGLFLNSCVVFGTANAQTHLDTPLPLELALQPLYTSST